MATAQDASVGSTVGPDDHGDAGGKRQQWTVEAERRQQRLATAIAESAMP